MYDCTLFKHGDTALLHETDVQAEVLPGFRGYVPDRNANNDRSVRVNKRAKAVGSGDTRSRTDTAVPALLDWIS